MNLTKRLAVAAFTASALMSGVAGATAQTQQMPDLSRAEMKQIFVSCREDYKRYCSTVEPGEGRIARCMADNRDQLSSQCRTTVRNIFMK
ncbi:cysteine rich repeat-containing protein [Acuticoccus yangtzensis]|uniref:cysteine rich repeat-containing protein n=1 Tax=Acuticoccus yangtzensis TaxID=1443441 RepID=UPI00094968C2|nr:cysteine rich repeat-containing protein [Acuticoccus yangtzensis]ORE96341.1 hypothetical protein ATO13_05745 [Stappia sp. 22II-S9-Z10]